MYNLKNIGKFCEKIIFVVSPKFVFCLKYLKKMKHNERKDEYSLNTKMGVFISYQCVPYRLIKANYYVCKFDNREHFQKAFIRYNDTQDRFRGKRTWRELLPHLVESLTKNQK